MPSGRTHDRITLWSLPLIAGLTFERTQNSNLTLFVSGGYLFSGLMFGPDLDVYSRHYQRWGLLRWIWLPYRRSMRHRSFWSHGLIAGTVVRVVYLLIWAAAFDLVAILVGAIVAQLVGFTTDWRVPAQEWLSTTMAFVERSPQQYPTEAIAIAIGLELGALSHTITDWLVSNYRRMTNRRTKKASPSQRSSLPPKLLTGLSDETPNLDGTPKYPFSAQSNGANPRQGEPKLPPFGRRKE